MYRCGHGSTTSDFSNAPEVTMPILKLKPCSQQNKGAVWIANCDLSIGGRDRIVKNKKCRCIKHNERNISYQNLY